MKQLPDQQRAELVSLISEFSVLFLDELTQTHLIEHDIDVGEAKPKQYVSASIVFHCISSVIYNPKLSTC